MKNVWTVDGILTAMQNVRGRISELETASHIMDDPSLGESNSNPKNNLVQPRLKHALAHLDSAIAGTQHALISRREKEPVA